MFSKRMVNCFFVFFSERFGSVVARCREIDYSMGGLQRAVNSIMVDNIVFLFDCRAVSRASDWVAVTSSVCFGVLVLGCRCLLWVITKTHLYNFDPP